MTFVSHRFCMSNAPRSESCCFLASHGINDKQSLIWSQNTFYLAKLIHEVLVDHLPTLMRYLY